MEDDTDGGIVIRVEGKVVAKVPSTKKGDTHWRWVKVDFVKVFNRVSLVPMSHR